MAKEFEKTEAFFNKGNIKRLAGSGKLARIVENEASVKAKNNKKMNSNINNIVIRKLPPRGRG